jgi:nucleoside transporter
MLLRTRLSLMMFLQYFVWGAWYVTLGTYLSHAVGANGGRIFTDSFVGDAFGTAAIAAMIAPFFVGMMADRFFATERLLAVLHLAGGAFLYYLSTVRAPILFYGVALVYFMTFMPTVALSNSISLHNLPEPTREFPLVRVWGTIGWIAAGVLVGALRIEATALPMVIAAAAQVLLALVSLALPHTPPSPTHHGQAAPSSIGSAAIELMKDWPFAVFMFGSFLVSIPMQFYYTFTNPFLNELGVTNAAGKQTSGQLCEIVCMLLMPLFFSRLGVKWMLVVGAAAWALRYLLFAFGDAGTGMWMLYGGLVLHGVCYVLFFVTGQIYVDVKASRQARAAAQGFLTVVTLGLGQLVGSVLSGRIVRHFASPDAAVGHDWRQIWLLPTAIATGAVVFFIFAFRDSGSRLLSTPKSIMSSVEEPVLQLPHGTLD